MFFNFFLFSLIIYNAASDVVVNLFHDFLGGFGIRNLVAIEVDSWPVWTRTRGPITRRRCCLRARCWSRAGATAVGGTPPFALAGRLRLP